MMDGGWGGWMFGGVALMVAFWGLLFWAVVSLVRRPGREQASTLNAKDVLAERFARGEIDAEEYETRRTALSTR
jgi:putative membrane protein